MAKIKDLPSLAEASNSSNIGVEQSISRIAQSFVASLSWFTRKREQKNVNQMGERGNRDKNIMDEDIQTIVTRQDGTYKGATYNVNVMANVADGTLLQVGDVGLL